MQLVANNNCIIVTFIVITIIILLLLHYNNIVYCDDINIILYKKKIKYNLYVRYTFSNGICAKVYA